MNLAGSLQTRKTGCSQRTRQARSVAGIIHLSRTITHTVRIKSSPFLALLAAIGLAAQDTKATDPLAAYMGHGVSHPLAIWRASTVSNVRYDLSLDVTAPDSAIGHVAVRFSRTGNAHAILDGRGRRLTKI